MKKSYFTAFILLPVVVAAWDSVYQELLHIRRMRKIYNTAGYIAYRLAQEEAKIERQKNKKRVGWP